MKTSFDKFMASNAVTEVSNVELASVKVDLAMDVNAMGFFETVREHCKKKNNSK